MPGAVTLSMWSEQDGPPLALANALAMTLHLNGPESADALHERHRRYLRLQEQGAARMFRIDRDGAPLRMDAWLRSARRPAVAAADPRRVVDRR